MQKNSSVSHPAEKDIQRLDMEKTLQATVLFSLLVGLVTTVGVYFIETPGWERLRTSAFLVLIISIGLWVLLKLGYSRLVPYGMVFGFSGIAIYSAWIGVGVRGTAYASFPIIVFFAALFISRRAGYLMAGLATLMGIALVWANRAGLLRNVNQPLEDLAVWLNISIYFFVSAVILDIVLRHVDQALYKQTMAEEELRQLNADLERRIAERTAQLLESEMHYRLIAENASDVIWTTDLNLRPTYISPSAERARGYTIQEMMEQPIVESLAPESYAYVKSVLAEELPKAQLYPDSSYFRTLELEYIHKNGTTYWSEVKVSFLRDENGEVIGLLGVGRNIQERKKAELALRESEERYRLVTAISSDYVFSTRLDSDGRLNTEWISGAFEAITGYSVDEFQMRGGWSSILHPDDFVRDAQDLANLHANRRVITEVRILHKTGSTRWVRVYAHPLWDDQRNILTGIFGAVQDITEKKQAEIRAIQQREMLEKVIALGQAVTQHSDLKSCLQQIHNSIKIQLGFDRVGLLLYDPDTNQLQDTLVPSELSEIDDSSWYLRAVTEHETWNAVMRTPKGLTIIDEIPSARTSLPGEKTRPMRQHATLAAWAGDKPVALIAVDNALTRQPMTEDKLEALKLFAGYAGLAIENARWNANLEQRVAERTKELQTAIQELQSFTYTIAHDLRAPARAMIGFSRLLEEEYTERLDSTAQHYLTRLNNGAQRMGKMIDGLLAFTQLGRQTVRKKPLDMASLVYHVLEEFQPERDQRQIEIIIGALPDAQADAEMVEELWRQLITNAFKFTRPRTLARIEIGSLTIEGKSCYFVKDNGVGFDMQYADKLFGVFQRLHLEEEFEGLGIGLAIVYRILQRHSGYIWADAELGRGATFYFSLP